MVLWCCIRRSRGTLLGSIKLFCTCADCNNSSTAYSSPGKVNRCGKSLPLLSGRAPTSCKTSGLAFILSSSPASLPKWKFLRALVSIEALFKVVASNSETRWDIPLPPPSSNSAFQAEKIQGLLWFQIIGVELEINQFSSQHCQHQGITEVLTLLLNWHRVLVFIQAW